MLIGIIISGLVEEYSVNLLNGIEFMASKDDVKLVVIPGKYLQMNYERDFDNKYGYCSNSLFSYGLLECFDGLIIEMASTMMYADNECVTNFADMFDNIPHVFISYDKTCYGSVSIDNRAGLMDALEYTYNNGARKYAMIGGPDNNIDALIRRDCFFDFLRSRDLDYSNKSYETGSFFLDCDKQLTRLVSNNLDADVFVCANDVLAVRLYSVLNRYNIRPGKDVSVIGFDDSSFCKTAYPTISSVRTDISEVGKRSYSLLMDAINNKKPRKVMVPSEFVLRDSIIHRESDVNRNLDIEQQFMGILKANSHIEDHPDVLRQGLRYFGIFMKLDTATPNTILGTIKRIDDAIDDMFLSESMAYIDWELLVNLVDKKYKANLALYTDPAIVESLTESYVKFLHKMMKYTQTMDEEKGKIRLKYNHQKEAFFRDTMHYARSTESNYARFLENMDFMGIRNAYLYLYDNSISYIQDEEFIVPEKLYLKAVLSQGKSYNISSNNQTVMSSNMFTNKYVDWDNHGRLIMFPIYSENYLYGVIVCDMKRTGFKHIEMFTTQISAAIRMLQLRMENKKIMDEYEESMRTLRENNISLDKMSKTDPLTGLNNRRGFYHSYDKLRRKNKNTNSDILIGCADMNSLKIVNDRYGHEDGDFAIKTIGDILTSFSRKYNGFAARLGGDEFAFVITVPENSSTDIYHQEIHTLFDEFNKTCDKPYLVSVSVGIFSISHNDLIPVDDAMAKADELLYVEKCNKPNIIK